jgi:undecaprenyl-diphosphatase
LKNAIRRLAFLLFPLLGLAAAAADSVPAKEKPLQLDVWNGILLGIVQGVTEFLPISSSAHLKVVPMALGLGDPGEALTAVIQLGSIAAVIWYFRQDIISLTRGSLVALQKRDFADHDLRLSFGIALGTLPICVLGLAIKLFFKTEYEVARSLGAIAAAAIALSLLLLLAEKLAKHTRSFAEAGFRDCLLIGTAQALAIFPGVSRSGATLTAALFSGMKRSDAARFSFLLGIPAIVIAGVVEMKEVLEHGTQCPLLPLAVSVIAAAISSYLAIDWMIGFLKKHDTSVFIIYRLCFGVAILVWIYHLANK